MAIFPMSSMPILSKTQLLPALTSLPLGTDTEASLLPASNANPRGFDIVTHNPTDNFNTSKSLPLTYPIYQQSHQSKVYLTIPGSY